MEFRHDQIVTASAANQIAEAIQQAIVNGTLKADDRLPTEEALALQFRVSRPTVREALKRLAARHLIRSRRGPTGGTFVNGPSPDELAQSFSTAATLMVAAGGVSLDEMATVRAEMEAICCRLAAQNRTAEQLAGMRAEIALQHSEKLADEAFCASDVRFHRLIVEAGGNALLRFLMNAVVEGLMPVSNMIIFRVRDRKIISSFHVQIADAIEDRDGAAAVAALNGLIRYIRDQYAIADEARQKHESNKNAPKGD
jgi:DNA-binding FadR family transcriptional regulator